MITNKQTYLCLDVGGRRIGLALGDSIGRIAQPLDTLIVDGQEKDVLKERIKEVDATDIVIGLPRNQSGQTTLQTQAVKEYVKATLSDLNLPIHWQDESVTSVLAEERLKSRKKNYTKADIDAEAAAIILQDYLEAR